MPNSEVVQRRHLPHWYVPNTAHFITYRLAGTLPATVVVELNLKKEFWKNEGSDRVSIHKRLFAAYEAELDVGFDIDWLRDPRVAAVIRENLYHHDQAKYVLHAYCIMPNHVHALLTPHPEFRNDDATQADVGESADQESPLSKIMHRLKSFTANEANRILNRSGRFWQAESYDHWVRDDDEMERIVNYIRANPVKANLVTRHEDWFWSSCHDRFLRDGDSSGWLFK